MCDKDVNTRVFLGLDDTFVGAQMLLLQPGHRSFIAAPRSDTIYLIVNSVIRFTSLLLSPSGSPESKATKNTTEATQDDTTLQFPSLFLALAKMLCPK